MPSAIAYEARGYNARANLARAVKSGSQGSLSDLDINLILEMDNNGTLRGATAGSYTGPLHDEASILAALTGDEFCSEWQNTGKLVGSATQATEANQPKWITAAEGGFLLPSLEFVRTSANYMSVGQVSDISLGGSIVIVFRMNSVAHTRQVIFANTSASISRTTVGLNTDTVGGASWFDGAPRGNRSATIVINKNYILQYYYKGDLTGRMWLNGVEQTEEAILTGQYEGDVGARIGRGTGSGTDRYFDGRIAAVFVRGGKPNGWGLAYREAIDLYLQSKYGVQFP